MSKDSVATATERIQETAIWTFKKNTTIIDIRKRLKELSIEPITKSTVVSYCFGDSGDGDLTTYGTSSSYVASPDLDLKQMDRFFHKSYYRPTDNSWKTWYVVYENVAIGEEEFYEAVIYSRPERVLNFQHLLFTRGDMNYSIEFNHEARMTLLKISGPKTGGESIFGPMLDGSISQADYLWKTFSNDSYIEKTKADGDMDISTTKSDRKAT